MRVIGQLADKTTLRKLYGEKPVISESIFAAILDSHHLGRLQSVTPLGGNLMNVVYDLQTSDGYQAILKIQFRAAGSVEAEHKVIELLRSTALAPVSEWSFLDATCHICPYPYVLFSKLPGQSAREVFEASDAKVRQRLAQQLGHILGIIHSQPVPSDDCLGRGGRTSVERSSVTQPSGGKWPRSGSYFGGIRFSVCQRGKSRGGSDLCGGGF
jgi:hypothetical protein